MTLKTQPVSGTQFAAKPAQGAKFYP